jgi:hypothetical protein
MLRYLNISALKQIDKANVNDFLIQQKDSFKKLFDRLWYLEIRSIAGGDFR